MIKYFNMGPFVVPSYGFTVLIGVLICNLIMGYTLRTDEKSLKEALLLELCGGIGAIAGAKLLGAGAYSYFGGLLGFCVVSYGFVRLFRMDGSYLAGRVFWLITLLHSIWKIGCFLGGCCYGIPYEGPFAVIFPEGVNELGGVSVFPVQIAESLVAFIIAIAIVLLVKAEKLKHPVPFYLVVYGLSRFFLEFLRYHNGKTLGIAHLYAVLCVLAGCIVLFILRRKENGRERSKDI